MSKNIRTDESNDHVVEAEFNAEIGIPKIEDTAQAKVGFKGFKNKDKSHNANAEVNLNANILGESNVNVHIEEPKLNAEVNLGRNQNQYNNQNPNTNAKISGNVNADFAADSPERDSKKLLIQNNNPPQKINLNRNGEYFGIGKDDILHIFDAYQRFESFDHDILEVQNNGGIESIMANLRTSFEGGIPVNDTNDNLKRIEAFGENKFVVEPMPHCCEYVWEGLGDLMVRILIGAAIFQIIAGSIPQIQESENDYVEGLSIVFAVVVVVSVGSIVNFTKEGKFRELNDQNQGMITYQVRRGGKIHILKEEEILAGDVIMLELGNILPADGILIQGNSVKMDEACLTGEADLVEKESMAHCIQRQQEEFEIFGEKKPKGKHLIPSPLVFSGTKAEEGSGWYIALRIGPNSEGGKIREAINAERSNKKERKKKKEENAEEVNDEKKNDKKEDEPKEGEGEKKEEDDDDEEEKKQTPLEKKLEDLATDISTFGLVAAIATFVALICRMIYFHVSSADNEAHAFFNERSNWYNTTVLGEVPRRKETYSAIKVIIDFIRIIILCIAIIVVAIPEGLPLAVTLSLSVSISKMMDDNNLVRQMSACETMGGANYICSDKTGTLTKNEMSVDQFFNCDEQITFKEMVRNKETREDPTKYFNPQYFEVLKQAICLNIEATFNDDDSIKKASKTDIALIEFMTCLRVSMNGVKRDFYPPLGDDNNKKRFPFSSSRKKMSTIVDSHKHGSRMYLKGASEIVLASCSQYLNPKTGEKTVITDEKKNSFLGIIKVYADLALRTICLAYKDISPDDSENWKAKDEEGKNTLEKDQFCLLGIFGINDILRDGVPEAVEKCKGAGITVVMVTGDNIDTANAIAKNCNIVTKEDEDEYKRSGKPYSLEGKIFYDKIGGMVCDVCNLDCAYCNCPRTEAAVEVMKLKKKQAGEPDWEKDIPIRSERIKDMEAFKEIYKSIKVIARSRPEDKYTLVFGLKELEYIVAVTGDGTNDAPALSKSNVGFAMGISGTEIAKQAADIIILDDNFATIVQAVKWGRNIYDNIRKFVQFQLSVNLVACLIVFLSCCIGNETPLNAIQMLWVNLIMDSLGALALATEPPYDELLNRPPTARDEYIINPLMWKHIVYQSLVQLIILLVLYLYGHRFIPETNKLNQDVARILITCFGHIPGQKDDLVQNYDMMIAGPSLFWSLDSERLPDATPASCGHFFEKKNLYEAQHYFMSVYGSAHITVVFNTFVIYTLFNQINVRKIDDSYNTFMNLHLNWTFIVLFLIEFGMQVIIVQASGIAFKVSIYGLDGPQWGICIGLSLITFIVNLILKPIPIQNCFIAMGVWLAKMKGKSEEELAEEEKKNSKDGAIELQGGLKAEVHVNVEVGGDSKKLHPVYLNI